MSDINSIIRNCRDTFDHVTRDGIHNRLNRPYKRLRVATGCAKGFIHRALSHNKEEEKHHLEKVSDPKQYLH